MMCELQYGVPVREVHGQDILQGWQVHVEQLSFGVSNQALKDRKVT